MNAAVDDVISGAKLHQFWLTFGMNDIRSKYRRSVIGQWWITLNVAFFIIFIGTLYYRILGSKYDDYILYLAVGYIVWLLISDSLTAGGSALIQAKPFLQQRSWPTSTFVFRSVYRELILSLHHFILIPPIMLLERVFPSPLNFLLAVLGLAITLYTSFWGVLLLSIINLRYRDVPPIVQNLLRLIFFATPILWVERDLGSFGEYVVNLNPFSHYLAIIRDPLMNHDLDFTNWLFVIIFSVGLTCVSLITLSLSKNKIPYWM